MKIIAVASTLAVTALLFAPVQAADIAAGQAKYAACVSCHGPAGQGMAIFPSVAGKDADYLADRLKTYRSGTQVGANTALMAPMAMGLSDDDIANLAAYMSTSFR
jgi:cytochrome c553